tara:strand:+ start:691 stop:837 length:147 start_codon:yes stop_codon:yes gene_type:complete
MDVLAAKEGETKIIKDKQIAKETFKALNKILDNKPLISSTNIKNLRRT